MRRLPLAVAVMFLSAYALAGQMQVDAARQRATPHYRTGLEYLRVEAWPDAEKSFAQAVDIDPEFEIAFYFLGRALMPQKKYVEAASAFARSRDLYRAQSGRRFSNIQEAQRYRKDQMMELDEIIRQYQVGPQSMRTSETVRQLTERRRQLQETISRGMNLSIENTVPAYVSLSLGSAYFRSGRIADAEREYKAAIEADPKSGEAHSNLAVVYLETGRYDDAERAVKAAEKAGFKVHPQLKQDIKDRRKGT